MATCYFCLFLLGAYVASRQTLLLLTLYLQVFYLHRLPKNTSYPFGIPYSISRSTPSHPTPSPFTYTLTNLCKRGDTKVINKACSCVIFFIVCGLLYGNRERWRYVVIWLVQKHFLIENKQSYSITHNIPFVVINSSLFGCQYLSTCSLYSYHRLKHHKHTNLFNR